MAVTLFTDRRMIEHRVPPRHPERPERLQAILRHLRANRISRTLARPGIVREATRRGAAAGPSAGYLRGGRRARGRGGRLARSRHLGVPAHRPWPLAWPPVRPIEAVSDVMSGRDRRALCLVRPPGHHARPGDGMGFCIYAQRRRWRRPRRSARFQLRVGPDRRLRRPPRQRHPGDLLRLGASRLPVDPSLSVLSGNRRRGRDRARGAAWATR